ncbi:MAG: 4-hydroxy-tetrahydrodipicolinate reductase [Endomicrobiia bacterium]
MIKIIINGALGKMGKRITEIALQDNELEIVGLVDIVEKEISVLPQLPKVVSNIEKYINSSDVVIDFSSPEGTINILNFCQKHKKPVVIGTTGHNEEQTKLINDVSKEIPIVFSPNMSLGVNLLFKLIDFVTKIFANKDYDIEIIELHHNKKKDAPSGTAKKIMDIIKTVKPDTNFVFGRNGIVGERKKDEVGVSSIRCGDIVGEHIVIYSTEGEILELKHTATSRDTFAKGALVAARWILGKNPGLYNMFDVLGI